MKWKGHNNPAVIHDGNYHDDYHYDDEDDNDDTDDGEINIFILDKIG